MGAGSMAWNVRDLLGLRIQFKMAQASGLQSDKGKSGHKRSKI